MLEKSYEIVVTRIIKTFRIILCYKRLHTLAIDIYPILGTISLEEIRKLY